MKIIKEKVFSVCVIFSICCLITSIVLAQPDQNQRPQPPSASSIVEKLQQELDLSDRQVIQVTPIIESQIQQMRSMMEDMKGQRMDRDLLRAKLEQILEQTENKLSKHLTAEQMKKWKERQAQRGQQGRNAQNTQ
ncbi:MAG: hypothetical protein PHP69_06655 [Candidatus Omnitrophica bacterium]|nr:hypothetical protein [Candidatus Omnitrophota bacterium]MDD5081359.1 hypothetical protein [Candidatus Omnitrophota bacterium]MDD5441655.1 hypothetical protein [Candidatus Omnitrophota bacterium]